MWLRELRTRHRSRPNPRDFFVSEASSRPVQMRGPERLQALKNARARSVQMFSGSKQRREQSDGRIPMTRLIDSPRRLRRRSSDMAKGKSRTNFTGVSRFLDAFTTADTESAASSQASESTVKETEDDTRPTKKRKTGALKLLPPDSAYWSYDATGLVPFYTEASQVPEDLKKCTFNQLPPKPLTKLHVYNMSSSSTQISLNDAGTSRSTTRGVS